MKLILGLMVFLPVNVLATSVGFVRGNTRTAVELHGEVFVLCPNNGGAGPGQAVHYCRGYVMEPSSYDYFRGPDGLVASEVSLTATREDGSTRTKRSAYDGQTYRSTDSFNLWISTLFQRPLLKEGQNKISYTLSQDQTIVGQGEFQVLVQDGPARQCPRSTYHSSNPEDCRSSFSVCDRYFSQYNNCKIK